MEKSTLKSGTGLILGSLAILGTTAYGDGIVDLSAFPVYAGTISESDSLGAIQLNERMEREVRVDLQSRGGARYQTDISIRGGIFEGTGLLVGGLALFDPQTGHYFSEIPLDPAFFSGARLLTGVSNAVYGFNSTAGSIDWNWGALEPGGITHLSLGSDNLWGANTVVAGTAGESLGWQIAYGRESGDGSIEFGDFDLSRISARIEFPLGTGDISGGTGKLRLFGGYVDKYYGWPGMYTGVATLNETDHYQVSLLGWQYETRGDQQVHRIGGYWRKLDDDYEFNRSSRNKFFEHETEVWSLQGDGGLSAGMIDLSYRWALVKDELVSSTSLVNGSFTKRKYAELALLGERRLETEAGDLTLYGGMGLDSSDRDSTVGLPQVGARLSGSLADGTWEVYAEYSESSQVPGYTVLKSRPSGLFGGNADLGRERAETVEAGLYVQQGNLSGKVVAFERRDANLADWVFSSASPNARQAAPVDITVGGIEAWLGWRGSVTAVELGYAFLDKDSDYGSASVDASFYALNYAKHRILATVEHQLVAGVWVRIEAEYRDHPANTLRVGGDEALLLHAQASFENFGGEGWRLLLRLDNLTDEDFQPIPGTPGPGREGQATVSYAW